MNYIKYIFAFAVLVVLGTSCEDYLTKTIEFEELGFEPAIVVNAKIVDSLDYLDISISKNVNYANNSSPEYTFIEGAVVKITIAGETFTAIEKAETGTEDLYNHRLDFPQDFVLTGKKYELEVTHPDYPTATSEVEIVAASDVVDVEYEAEARTGSIFGYPVVEDRTTFTIVDKSTERNYYKIQIVSEDGGRFPTTTDDPNALEAFQSVLLSDENFSGTSTEIEIFSVNFNSYYYGGGGDISFRLEVRNISRSEYLFQQSYSRYRSSQDFGFFAEPTTLFTNIENGFGIFSAEEIQVYDL